VVFRDLLFSETACSVSAGVLLLWFVHWSRLHVPAEEEYPALKTKKARTAQGIFDYMNKMEGGR
jgi:hypothetical protein